MYRDAVHSAESGASIGARVLAAAERFAGAEAIVDEGTRIT